MSKHTKGKWEAQLLKADGVVIKKDAWEIRTPEYDVATEIPQSAPIRREADARLISAAPELLEALIDAKEHLEYCGYGDSYERKCAESEGLEDKINKAIAKAEGGRP